MENAYDDFKDKASTGEILPYCNFPIYVDPGQVFVVDNHVRDDSFVKRKYFVSDGSTLKDSPVAREIVVE